MSDPMRVTIVGSAPPQRGISSYCLELARSVSRHATVELLGFRTMYPRLLYPGGDLREDATFPDFQGVNLTIRRPLDWYNPAGWITVAYRIRAGVAHFQHWSLPLTPVLFTMMAVLKRRGIRTVITLHNVMDHGRGRLYSLATRRLCRLADRCVVHSELNARTAVDKLGVPPGKIRRIRHGALAFFREGELSRASAREHLGLPPGSRIVLFFGAIRPYKGLDVLLRAFARVRAEIPDALLVVAGKTWVDWAPYGKLAARVNGGEGVRTFLRYIDTSEVKFFFEAADLVVLPYTHFDAQSGVGAAALAFSKPMIVSEVGALPELVRDARCLVPPDNSDVLAERLLLGLKDEVFREQMAKEAKAIALEHSWERIAEETVSLYAEVLDR